MQIKPLFPRWQARIQNFLLMGSVSLAFAGCNDTLISEDKPYDASVEERLYLVPSEALFQVKEGLSFKNHYSGPHSDAYLNNTYLLKGTGKFKLSAYNSAESDVSRLGTNGEGLQLVAGANDISDAQLVVEVQNKNKLKSVSVNGKILYPSDFTYGTPSLLSGLSGPSGSSGNTLNTDGRLPGYYAVVSIGFIAAGSEKDIVVILDGACDLAVHFDVYGKANCEKAYVNKPRNGTTIIEKREKCENGSHDGGGDAYGDSYSDGGSDAYRPDVCLDTSKPDTSKPDTSKPDTSKPDTSKPDTSKPDTSKPDTTLDTWKPDTQTPDCVEDASKPDTSKPDSTPDTSKPDVTSDVCEDTSKPDTSKPDSTPDTSKPDTSKPDTTLDTWKPDTQTPDCVEDASKPDTSKPDSTPDASKPDVTSDVCEDTSKPDTSKPDVCEDTSVVGGCTLTIGFWKNHAEQITAKLSIWLGAENGGNSISVKTAVMAVSLLSQNVYGSPSNGITKLYAQLLAAKLNGKNGASTSSINSIIAAADAFLASHSYTSWDKLSSTEKGWVLYWHSKLDEFNNGKLGPQHCDSDQSSGQSQKESEEDKKNDENKNDGKNKGKNK